MLFVRPKPFTALWHRIRLTRNNLDQFKHDFNSADGELRLVLLLSPA